VKISSLPLLPPAPAALGLLTRRMAGVEGIDESVRDAPAVVQFQTPDTSRFRDLVRRWVAGLGNGPNEKRTDESPSLEREGLSLSHPEKTVGSRDP
jgi:hypothetical protein